MKKYILFLSCMALAVISKGQQLTGILGAFPPELVLLEQQMSDTKVVTVQGTRFVTGTLRGKSVVLAQTGVGKVNAAITTTLLLDHFKPARVLFSGIAGGLDTALSPGDIVIATQVGYHDYGVLTDSGLVHGATRHGITMTPNPEFFSSDSQLVEKAATAAKHTRFEASSLTNKRLPVVRQGIIVTGDVFVSGEMTTGRLRNQLRALATEMEGAAIAQVCYQQQVPFVIIRSMSDRANSAARADMRHFYEVAARNAATLVMALLAEL